MSISIQNYESEYIKVDISEFPFVRIQLKPFQPTTESMDSYMEHLDALHSQPEPFVILMEFPQKLMLLKAEHRIRIGKWMKENEEKVRTCKATAFVMPSILYKIVMQGVFLIQTPFTDYKVVDKIEKAEEWLHEKMKEENISVPSTNL
jgi:hypothetical protein